MKFSLWQIMVALTVSSVALVFRVPLFAWFQRNVGIDGVLAYALVIVPMLVFYLFVSGVKWIYTSLDSPIRKIVVATNQYRQRPLLGGIRHLLLGREWVAYGVAAEAYAKIAEDTDAALQLANEAINVEPNNPNGYASRAMTYNALGNYEQAIADLNKAIELSPFEEQFLTQRGFAHAHLGNFQACLDDLLTIDCETQDQAMTAFFRGHCFEHTGDWQCALEDYELAARLDRNFYDPVLGLSVVQSSCPLAEFRDGKKALENAERICILREWQDWISISCLAAAHAELGDFENAVKYAQKSYELAPEEEKATRKERLEQFQAGKPYRRPSP